MVPFDSRRLILNGTPTVVLDVATDDVVAKDYDVSPSGALVYVSRSSLLDQLVWKDRQGNTSAMLKGQGFQLPALSPDDRRVAVTIQEGVMRNVWSGPIGGPLTRVTFGNDDTFPLWTLDGKRIVFTAAQVEGYNLFWTSADGAQQPERLTISDHSQRGTSWSPRGDILLYNDLSTGSSTGLDIWQLTRGVTATARPYIQTKFNELGGTFSPDGRSVAYMSNKTGRHEVYAQAFPGPGGKTRISTDGGAAPAWSADGRELFYETTAIMAVPVLDHLALRMGVPTKLVAHRHLTPGTGLNYAVTRDGQRFLMVESAEGGEPSRLNLVLDWFDELRRVTPK